MKKISTVQKLRRGDRNLAFSVDFACIRALTHKHCETDTEIGFIRLTQRSPPNKTKWTDRCMEQDGLRVDSTPEPGRSAACNELSNTSTQQSINLLNSNSIIHINTSSSSCVASTTLGVCSAKRRHQSPKWMIMSHVNCLIQGEVVGFQVLLDCLHPRSTRVSWWSPPVLQAAADIINTI